MCASFETVKKLEGGARRCSLKKSALEISQNSEENICAGVLFLIKLQSGGLKLYQKQTLAQVFSGRFCKVFSNAYFEEHLRTVASKKRTILQLNCFMCDFYGIQFSHILEIPGISNENLVFQLKYSVFPSKTLDFDRNTGYQNNKLRNTRFFTP